MELPIETKREVLKSLIEQAHKDRYTQECLGKAYQVIGNAPQAEAAAKAIAQSTQAIAEFEKQLEELV